MAYVLPEPPIAGPALHEPAACTPLRPEPNEPERRSRSADIVTAQPGPGGTLHESATPAMPNEPERRPAAPSHARLADV